MSLFVRCVVFGFLILHCMSIRAQVSQISGIINIYTPVVAVSCNTIEVVSSTGFTPGDKVFIIQMKGATVDQSNSPSFGTVLNYNECGNNEFAVISSVNGSTITTMYPLINTYNVSAYVQLIRVPQYADANVNAVLTCQNWNGLTGGILVFEVSNTLTLGANVDVTGKGFRGASACSNPNGSCPGSVNTDYFHSISSGLGAEKGEGVTDLPVTMRGGRGSGANGGGGGNKHNSGGGGGANFSMGGMGGFQANFCPSFSIGGQGGKALSYTAGKLFLAGGGGSPDHNNGVGTFGTNGGGMVIIKTATLAGAGYTIRANAPDVNLLPNGIGDGAGGGGAGGTVFLDVGNYTGALNVEANGGDGGSQNTSYPSCFGPGGGGGVGVLLLTQVSQPINVLLQTQSGAAGIDLNPTSTCYNTSYGAQPGIAATGLVTNAVIEQNTTAVSLGLSVSSSYTACDSVAVLTATANPGVNFLWNTGSTNSQIQISSGGTYTVTAQDAAGCIETDTISIPFQPTGDISIAVSDDSVCLGNTVGLTVITSSSAQVQTYTWTYGTVTANTQHVSDTPSSSLYYYVTVSYVAGCTYTDSVYITVLDMPNATFVSAQEGCAPFTANFNSPFAGYVSYTWNFGDGTFSSGQNVQHTYLNAGTYTVSLMVENAGGCTDFFQVGDAVSVYPLVNADFTFQQNPDYGIQFTPQTTGNYTYQWDFGNGGSSSEQTPLYYYTTIDNFYTVCLTITSVWGCIDSSCQEINKFQQGVLYIPNAFTPQDDGLNDVFMAQGTNISEFNMQVYNRWGQLVFETFDISIGWDGKHQGIPAESGIYLYKAIYLDTNTGITHQVFGHVSLLR